ncbi:MAG: hypothetical protein ACOC2W_03400 [bacterium]
MERSQIENIYKSNELNDYKLKSTDDLLRIHGIDYENINGYDKLDDLNKNIFKTFIVNFFNARGLVQRTKILPQGIYWVKEVEYLTEDDKDEEIFLAIKTVIYSINKDGSSSILHEYEEDKSKNLEVVEKDEKFYLRFEYKNDGCQEWMHVVNKGKDWY